MMVHVLRGTNREGRMMLAAIFFPLPNRERMMMLRNHSLPLTAGRGMMVVRSIPPLPTGGGGMRCGAYPPLTGRRLRCSCRTFQHPQTGGREGRGAYPLPNREEE